MSDIIFDEDKSILAPLDSEEKIPKSGFEGWFYKRFPGTFRAKKLILISVIIILFSISFVLLIMARYNSIQIDDKIEFSDRISKTKIK